MMQTAAELLPIRLMSAALLACICLPSLFACAPIQGYPLDPEDTDATLKNLAPYFNGTIEAQYVAAIGDAAKTPLRDAIVYARMRGYDIEFSDFEKALYSESNGVAVGSDLIGLILGGLTATTGNAATKAALGAASVGVLGANTAINKDLYYQKTIVALLAQMEANRAKAKLSIALGLGLPDTKYNLFQAYSDLDAYKNAGSIPGAISVITQSAETQKQNAQNQLVLQGITLETPAVSARYDILTSYILSLVAKKDATTLGKIADALGISVPGGSTYLQIKGFIVDYLYVAIDSKSTEADKQAALNALAVKLKPYVTF
jgi:hypothetical protein